MLAKSHCTCMRTENPPHQVKAFRPTCIKTPSRAVLQNSEHKRVGMMFIEYKIGTWFINPVVLAEAPGLRDSEL